MKSIGIKYQLRLTTLIPVLVVAVLFAIFYNGQFSQDMNHHMSRLGEAYIRQLLPTAQFALLRNDTRTLQGLINATTINSEIKALAFYNARGELMGYRGGKHKLKLPIDNPTFAGDTIESKQLSPYTINFIAPITIPKFNLYANPIHPNTPIKENQQAFETLGWMSLDIDTQSMLVKRYKMYIITIFITLMGLLLSLTVHFFLSRRLYLPIVRLRRSMKQILRNEFETQISTQSKGDLGVIERGALHLQQTYLNTLKDLNQHIEVATADLQQSLELLEEKNIELSLDKKKIEERAKQKTEFIANMSHEIRTPMNGILGFTNLLMESRLDALQVEYVKTIQSSAKDLLNTINDILDYSKMDAGKLKLDCIPLDIRHCIDEVLTLAAPIANKKGIDLIPLTQQDVPKTVLGDPLRIKQILTNLINNALKFTDHGYVMIRTQVISETPNQYKLALSIIDTGVGISKEDQSKLFNAFNQADTSITRRYGGSGLGLVICKKLAEQMQGRITLDSEPNKGSTFKAELTLEKYQAFEIEKHQTHRLSQLKVLCFDDNPLYLESLCLGLSAWSVETVPVSHLSKLKSTFKKNQDCHLALINVNQGCELQIAELIRHEKMPIILISKWPIANYEALGASGFLFKPVSIQKLHEVLDGRLQQQPNPLPNTPLLQLRQEMAQRKIKLLVAEDNPVNRLLLESLLSAYTSITTVADGDEAIEKASREPFHLILLDLQMPKVTGDVAAKTIKQNEGPNQHTPIILISASLSSEAKVALREGVVDLFLQKPVDEKSLLTHMQLLLEKKEAALIDWPGTLKKLSNNQKLANDYLKELINELDSSTTMLRQHHENKHDNELGALLHKLKGACCFASIPKLTNSLDQCELFLKAHDKEGLRETLEEVLWLIEQLKDEQPHLEDA